MNYQLYLCSVLIKSKMEGLKAKVGEVCRHNKGLFRHNIKVDNLIMGAEANGKVLK